MHVAERQRAGKQRRTRRSTHAMPAIVTTHLRPPEIRTATPNTTINTGYARYRPHIPPTAKSRTMTPCNHHRPTAIIAGSNGRFQYRRQKDVTKTQGITTHKWWSTPSPQYRPWSARRRTAPSTRSTSAQHSVPYSTYNANSLTGYIN